MSLEIELRGARVRYGPVEALHGVDLAVPTGGLCVLLGRNGSGRTTALHALAGTVRLSSGRVLWRGDDVTAVPAYRRARRGLALIPDRRPVFSSFTVAEHLSLWGDPAGGGPGPDPALDAFPALRPLLSHRAGTLSGGEQRMLALSRVLLRPARLLLLDEPALGLSPAAAGHAYAVLSALVVEQGRTLVMAEPRLPEAVRPVASVVYGLRRGAVVFAGEPAEPRPPP